MDHVLKIARRRLGCDAAGEPWPGVIDAERRFHMRLRVGDEDIDEMGHVNNAVWVAWLQDVSAAHWYHAARPEDRERYGAMVLHHDITYRGNVGPGADVKAQTWVDGPPRGVRYARRVQFFDEADRLLVSALSQWGVVEIATGRLVRVTPEIAGPFLP